MDGQHFDDLRVPPHSIDAEQAVLGGLMLSARAWDMIADRVGERDFYRADHRVIFRAIAGLASEQKPCDAVTLDDWLVDRNLTDDAGGKGYAIHLAATTPSAANIVAHADIVREKALLRGLIDAGTQSITDGFASGGRAPLELIGAAQSRLGSLLDAEPCELEPMLPVVTRVFHRIEDRYRNGGGIQGLTTGLSGLDAILGGLRPGQLGLLAARPKMGKTALAMNIAEHVALDLHRPVAFFSFEMQPDELVERMFSSIGGINSQHVRNGALDDEDWSSTTRTISALRDAPIYISRPRRARVETVVAQLRRQHAKLRIGLCVIDYLQLMEAPGENRNQAISDITRTLKLAAGEIGIPILLLSQLNRDLEKRADKRPMPSDLRDSGAIEQDADFVLFVYRDEVYNKASPEVGTAELIVALQRNGPPGTVRAQFQPEKFKFSDVPRGWAPTAPESSPRASSGWRRGGGLRDGKTAAAAGGGA